MRPDLGPLEIYRVTKGPMASDASNGRNGQFLLPRAGVLLLCQVSDGLDWEHASVTVHRRKGGLVKRTPSWDEMCFVKQAFWEPHELVVQYHPPESEYVNCHPYCLHLWLPYDFELPMPTQTFV